MDHDTSEQELITGAVAGDHLALTLILFRYYDRLEAHIAAKQPPFLRSLIEPADILQETFTQVWLHIHAFEPKGDGSFYAWLATIADRKLLDHIKAHNADKRGGGRAATAGGGPRDSTAQLIDELVGSGTSPSASAERNELIKLLQVAISQLPDDYREAIQLHYLDDLPVAVVAAHLNRTEHAVHMLMNRAKAKLREILGQSSKFFSSRG